MLPAIGLLGSIVFDRILLNQIRHQIFQLFIVSESLLYLGISLVLLEKVSDHPIQISSIKSLEIDWISAIFLVFVSFILLMVTIYSCFYIQPADLHQLFAMISSMYLGITIVLLSTNLISVFLGWELMVIAGYLLVIFNRSDKAIEAGIKYLILSTLGSMIMLSGIALLSGILDGLNYAELENISSLFWGRIAIGLILAGIGVTSGIIFLNQWLPDAHSSAPTPVSAILSGVLVKMGVYLTFRVIHPLYPSAKMTNLIMIIGVLTLTEGNIMVFSQFFRSDMVDIKRILAYSTVVHLGYLMIVVSQHTEIAILALVYHVINHGIAKTTLFLAVGYIYQQYHTKDLRMLKGILKRDYPLSVVFIISLFSLGGFPGTGGFVSKLLVLIAFYQDSDFTFGITIMIFLVLLANSLFAFVGYMLIVKCLVFDPNTASPVGKPDPKLRLPLYFLCSMIILLGIFPKYVLDIILNIMQVGV